VNRKTKRITFRQEAMKIAAKYGPAKEKWVLDSLMWAWDCGWKDSARTHGVQGAAALARLEGK
jgi:hypothetical protein